MAFQSQSVWHPVLMLFVLWVATALMWFVCLLNGCDHFQVWFNYIMVPDCTMDFRLLVSSWKMKKQTDRSNLVAQVQGIHFLLITPLARYKCQCCNGARLCVCLSLSVEQCLLLELFSDGVGFIGWPDATLCKSDCGQWLQWRCLQRVVVHSLLLFVMPTDCSW